MTIILIATFIIMIIIVTIERMMVGNTEGALTRQRWGRVWVDFVVLTIHPTKSFSPQNHLRYVVRQFIQIAMIMSENNDSVCCEIILIASFSS